MLYIERWWARKYHSSPKSDEFLSYTLTELLVEFFADMYLEDQKKMWADEKHAHGDVRLPEVGDHYVDMWEEQWQKGIMPDLTEGLPKKEREQIRERLARERKLLEKKKQSRLEEAFAKGISGASEYLRSSMVNRGPNG